MLVVVERKCPRRVAHGCPASSLRRAGSGLRTIAQAAIEMAV